MNVMKDNWDFLLSEFRRLGGIADNVCQKEGKYGRGIFPINPNLKARIFTPSKLFVKKDDIYLEDNKLRIKKDKNYSKEIRNFFSAYQDNFSWGFGGRETTEFFEKELSLFNPNLKALIKKFALVDIDLRHKGAWDNVVKNQFINARAFKFKDTSVIVPILELVNHKVRSFSFSTTHEGISTPNYPPTNSEIRHSYNNSSPINRFFSHGFYSEETIVSSVPFEFTLLPSKMTVCCNGKVLKNDSMKVERSKNKIILEGLPIADKNHPKLPYYYYRELIKRIGDNNIPEGFLSQIFQFNISVRKNIIDESLLVENLIAKTFIKVINYEINLIPSD